MTDHKMNHEIDGFRIESELQPDGEIWIDARENNTSFTLRLEPDGRWGGPSMDGDENGRLNEASSELIAAMQTAGRNHREAIERAGRG